MPMRFIESRDGYSVYTDEWGDRVYRRNTMWLDPTQKNHVRWEHTPTDRLTVSMAVDAATRDNLTLEEARALVSDTVEYEVSECAVCDNVIDNDFSSTVDGNTWCEHCVSDHVVVQCGACSEMVSDREDSFRYIEDGDDYCCEDCYYNGAAYYCDTHDRCYWADDACTSCEEESDCGCESPHMDFSIAGSDSVRFASGEHHVVHADDGIVSQYGYDRISAEVSRWMVDQYPIDPETEALRLKNGVIRNAARGAVITVWREDPSYRSEAGVPFAKRLRAEVYKRTKDAGHAVSLPSPLLSKIGTIARETSEGVDTLVNITRDLNMDAADFVHDESCWWTDYSYSRCTLKNNAGFGLRSFADGPRNWATGRVWVFGCKVEDNGRLMPTYDDAEAYVVFNGYGDLSEYRGARVLASMTGWTARPETLRMSSVCDLMYVNSGSARVVAPDDVLKRDDLYFSGVGMQRH